MNASPPLPSLIHLPPASLRLRIKATAEQIVRGGHPWVFAESIREQNRPGQSGELAILYDRKDRFLAIGLFDPESPLRVRILHAGRPVTLDDAWWQQRLTTALERRKGLFGPETTGFRWINGESDGWPGLVLDRYGEVLVLKLYSAAWLPRLWELCRWIREALSPVRLVLRLSRNLQTHAASAHGLSDGQELLPGAENVMPPAVPTAPAVEFLENGLRFAAEVVRGQKTGFFLDQRENRQHVGNLSAGRSVLNAFSFSGGFSLYAAKGGASCVSDLDISAHALAAGGRNFALNHLPAAVAACQREAIQADAFAWLEQNTARRFDVVILDPPSLARRETERAGAIQAYARLATGGARALRPRGVLVAASCSAHVSREEFFDTVRRALRLSGRTFKEIANTGHPPDHPATFPEAHYLKCIYLQG